MATPQPQPHRQREAYLGDGLYASHEPHIEYLTLRAPREGGDHSVSLEPPVLARFIRFAIECGYLDEIERAIAETKEPA